MRLLRLVCFEASVRNRPPAFAFHPATGAVVKNLPFFYNRLSKRDNTA